LSDSYHPTLFLARVISSTLKTEVTRSSETPVYNKPTWSHIPEDYILQLRKGYGANEFYFTVIWGMWFVAYDADITGVKV
jgi:hypothetical protein